MKEPRPFVCGGYLLNGKGVQTLSIYAVNHSCNRQFVMIDSRTFVYVMLSIMCTLTNISVHLNNFDLWDFQHNFV